MTETQNIETIASIARDYGKSVAQVQRTAGAEHISPNTPLSEFDASFIHSLLQSR